MTIGNFEAHLEAGAIQVQRSTPSTDSWGNPTKTWTTIATIDGRVRQLRSDEVVKAGKESVMTTHRLYTLISDIKSGDRIVYRGQTYQVEGDPNDVMFLGKIFQTELSKNG